MESSKSPSKSNARAYSPGLERYLLELELDGLTVVPQEVHGVADETIDALAKFLLEEAERMTGCRFDLATGPCAELVFPEDTVATGLDKGPAPSQFLIQQLAHKHRLFRDLAVNPTSVELMRHLIGTRATRFSSFNSFVKWQGEHGYGASLGLHADQTAVPLPWGRTALTANTNWCLTDYTLDNGCLAYVPGSHKFGSRPVFPDAVEKALPVEAPKGSLIVFHGATWHGAFPKKNPGMRLSIANYHRHVMVTSQENIRISLPRELARDCENPTLFEQLVGFEDEFPYSAQSQPVPRLA